MPSPIDVDRNLRRDRQGNMLWDVEDVLVETPHGNFIERRLVGQPQGGITMRTGPGGVSVYMYNEDPGVFLNERGAPVSDRFAEAAGFDVASMKRARSKKLAMVKMAAAVEDEFSHVENTNIVKERGDYRLVMLAPGHYAIHFVEADGTGSPLSATVLTEKAALKLFEELAPNADDNV